MIIVQICSIHHLEDPIGVVNQQKQRTVSEAPDSKHEHEQQPRQKKHVELQASPMAIHFGSRGRVGDIKVQSLVHGEKEWETGKGRKPRRGQPLQ